MLYQGIMLLSGSAEECIRTVGRSAGNCRAQAVLYGLHLLAVCARSRAHSTFSRTDLHLRQQGEASSNTSVHAHSGFCIPFTEVPEDRQRLISYIEKIGTFIRIGIVFLSSLGRVPSCLGYYLLTVVAFGVLLRVNNFCHRPCNSRNLRGDINTRGIFIPNRSNLEQIRVWNIFVGFLGHSDSRCVNKGIGHQAICTISSYL